MDRELKGKRKRPRPPASRPAPIESPPPRGESGAQPHPAEAEVGEPAARDPAAKAAKSSPTFGSPEPAPESAAEPASGPLPAPARAVLDSLRRRLAELLPGWEGRPEDPVQVLLELFAESIGEMRGDLAALDERSVERLLDRLGIEPIPPRPARGVVVFEALGGADLSIPAGFEIVAARDEARTPGRSSGPRVVFETVAPARLGPGRLVRAFAADGERVQEISVEGEANGPAVERAPVEMFGRRLRSGREFYLGDGAFLRLRAEGSSLAIEWPEGADLVAGALWEYRVAGGWRRLPVLFDRPPGKPAVLRMLLGGPLADLAVERREFAELPWLRCRLGSGTMDLPAPQLIEAAAADSARPRGGKAASGAASSAVRGRPIERVFLSGAGETLDFSFEKRIEAGPSPAEMGPAVYLGWDAPSAPSFFAALDLPFGEEVARTAGPVDFLWEYSGGGSWRPIPADGREDQTGGFTRSGTITVEPPADWEAVEHFGARLYWVRGLWREGERPAPAAIRALYSRGVEVVQGRTVARHPLPDSAQVRGGILAIPTPAEGEIDIFGRIELHSDGASPGHASTRSANTVEWCRVESFDGLGPGDPVFVLTRAASGGLRVVFGDGIRGRRPAEGPVAVHLLDVRVGIGSHGNVPAGKLRVLGRDVAGIAGVRNPIATCGGRDAEPLIDLRKRAQADWRMGGRAVTGADYERFARALVPGAIEVRVSPDRRQSGGVLVVLVPAGPREPGRFPPALLQAVETRLQDCAPLGTPVRVVEPAYLPVVAKVERTPAAEDRETLREDLHAEVLKTFSEVEGVDDRRLASALASRLGETVPCRVLMAADGRPPPFHWALDSPELIFVWKGVRFADE